MSARKTAFKALKKVAADASYSNLVLDSELEKSALEERDKRLASGIFYGVLENEQQLDFIIKKLLSKPDMKLESDVRILLRMGIFQLGFMDKIPDNAAVNETVTLAKKLGLSRASGFINGILRSYIRAGKAVALPERNSDETLYLSVKYSCPEWLIKLWIKDYGADTCEKILVSLHGRPPIYARVNNVKTDIEKLSVLLNAENAGCRPAVWPKNAVELSSTGSVEKLTAFTDGLFHVQDISSQLCCNILSPQSGETVLDVCAAPGGKSFTIAELMNNNGRVISCDIHEHRVGLIRSGAERLGLTCIEAIARDALTGDPVAADRVLCDVPCSGLGIIRRKPDIKNKKPETLAQLPQMQYDILCRSAKSVRPGGTLVYSTCTLCSDENSNVVERFLNEHEDFEPYPFGLQSGTERIAPGEPEYMLTLFPFETGSDGFFIARLKRKG